MKDTGVASDTFVDSGGLTSARSGSWAIVHPWGRSFFTLSTTSDHLSMMNVDRFCSPAAELGSTGSQPAEIRWLRDHVDYMNLTPLS
jgi:hypothetical protein